MSWGISILMEPETTALFAGEVSSHHHIPVLARITNQQIRYPVTDPVLHFGLRRSSVFIQFLVRQIKLNGLMFSLTTHPKLLIYLRAG